MPNVDLNQEKNQMSDFNRGYRLLNRDNRANLRHELYDLGLSRATFYRWTATNKVPFIWQPAFSKCLKSAMQNENKTYTIKW